MMSVWLPSPLDSIKLSHKLNPLAILHVHLLFRHTLGRLSPIKLSSGQLSQKMLAVPLWEHTLGGATDSQSLLVLHSEGANRLTLLSWNTEGSLFGSEASSNLLVGALGRDKHLHQSLLLTIRTNKRVPRRLLNRHGDLHALLLYSILHKKAQETSSRSSSVTVHDLAFAQPSKSVLDQDYSPL